MSGFFLIFWWFDVIISVQDLVIKSKWFYTVTFKNFKICSNDQSQIDNFSEPWLLTNSCVRWSNTGQSPLNAFSKFAEFCTRIPGTYTCSILIRKPTVQKRLNGIARWYDSDRIPRTIPHAVPHQHFPIGSNKGFLKSQWLDCVLMKYQAKTMYNFYVAGNSVSRNTSYCTKHNFTGRSGPKHMIANIGFGPSCIDYVIFGYQGKNWNSGYIINMIIYLITYIIYITYIIM